MLGWIPISIPAVRMLRTTYDLDNDFRLPTACLDVEGYPVPKNWTKDGKKKKRCWISQSAIIRDNDEGSVSVVLSSLVVSESSLIIMASKYGIRRVQFAVKRLLDCCVRSCSDDEGHSSSV